MLVFFCFNRSFCLLHPFVLSSSLVFICFGFSSACIVVHNMDTARESERNKNEKGHKITVMQELNMYHGILHDVLAQKKIRFILPLTPRMFFRFSMHLLNTITDFGFRLLYTTAHVAFEPRTDFYYRAKWGIRHSCYSNDCMPGHWENTQNEVKWLILLFFIHQFEFHWLLTIIIIFVHCRIIIMVSFSSLPRWKSIFTIWN